MRQRVSRKSRGIRKIRRDDEQVASDSEQREQKMRVTPLNPRNLICSAFP
jgi:hypothetical protein